MWTARSGGRKISFARMSMEHSHCWKRLARIGARCRTSERKSFRFLHVSTDEVYGSLGPDDPPFSETHTIRPEQSVCRVESCVRSPGARLSPHLWPADADHELLEQLRALSISREADSADDPQRARRESAAGVWGWQECPRLALCGGSLRSDRNRAAARADRERPTTSAAGTRSRTSRSCRRFAISWMRWRHGQTGSRRELITFVKDRPGHDRRYAMDARKIERELGWKPKATFESGIRADGSLVS